MNLTRCEQGHFYNASKFAGCPRCASLGNGQAGDSVTMPMGGQTGDSVTMPMGYQAGDSVTMPMQAQAEEDSVTVAMPVNQMEDSVTVPISHVQKAAPAPEVSAQSAAASETPTTPLKVAVNKAIVGTQDDDGKTVSLYHTKTGIDPVAGWLVCIEGDDFGGSFTIKSGRNFIGRSANMDIVLRGDNSISREKHAIILYEPRRREFVAQPGESRELFYINDEVVLNSVRLKQYDVLSIGNTRLMFFPCCGENFSWEDLKPDGV